MQTVTTEALDVKAIRERVRDTFRAGGCMRFPEDAQWIIETIPSLCDEVERLRALLPECEAVLRDILVDYDIRSDDLRRIESLLAKLKDGAV